MATDERNPAPGAAAADLPERFGPYRVEGRLGRGGMGEVFLACDERLGRRVALKRIRADAGASPAQRERFRREARAAAALSHPSLVQVYDILEDPAGDAIVMEYVEGRTLAALLAEGPRDAAFAVRLAREVVQGLAAAHAAGLVHRDLKAENVIVTPAERAKVLDFGLARPVAPEDGEERLTLQGTVLGTWHAMSPEQAGGGEADARSDLFSLGVLLYEMLTGRSPFRGSGPLDTLRKILTEPAPPVSALRPDLPRELAELVDRLLAKDREARPQSAGEVDAVLASMAALPGLASGTEPWGERLSELPTGPAPVLALPQLREGPTAPPSRISALSPRFRLRALVLLMALLVAATAGVTLFLRGMAPPLRIAVLPPVLKPAGDEQLGVAASGILVSTLATLSSLDGLAPLDPSQAGTVASPVEAARTAAAGEVLTARLERIQGDLGRISLVRTQGSDGRVLWAESFEVLLGPSDLRLLGDAVAAHLRRAFPRRALRSDTPDLQVRDEDYAAFLAVRQRIESGRSPLGPELERLETILRGSPRFLEAHLQAARCALSLFLSTRQPALLERALQGARTARELAPGDPRPLSEHVRVALAGGRMEEAERALALLEELSPADPEILVLRSRLAEARGNMAEALASQREAVRRVPSWRNLYRLADLEARSGRIAEARQSYGLLLERSPDNLWAREELAQMELLYGEPGRAEQLYRDLIARSAQRQYFTNLGLARFLLGRHAEAVAAYRRALAIDPGHVSATLNLADAELARGRREEAEALYRSVLERLEADRREAALGISEEMIRAQCLAHLSRTREAVQLTQQVLRQNPDNPEVLYLASLVYTLAGDRASALVNAELALGKGMQPRWFAIPPFAPLHGDPELRELLRTAYPGGPPLSMMGSP